MVKYNTLLDRICIESDLIEVNVNVNRAKIEHIDSDITCVLMKARKSAEGDAIRNDKSSEQQKLRATLAHWKLKLREKDGTNVDACEMKKRVDMDGLKSNVDHMRNEIKFRIEAAK